MQKITNAIELKNAIQLLEIEHSIKGRLLREHLQVIVLRLEPINLVKSSFGGIVSAPFLIENILGNFIGLSTGILIKKIVIGAAGNIFRKLFGTLLQMGIAKIVSQNTDTLKSVVHFLYKTFSQKK